MRTMRTITREVGKTSDGKPLVRNYFFFNDEKKQAKLNCKN